MQKITIQSELEQALASLQSYSVICDAAGRAIGFFSPLPGRPPVDDLQLTPLLSIEESKERCKEKTGRPLSEILDRLGL